MKFLFKILHFFATSNSALITAYFGIVLLTFGCKNAKDNTLLHYVSYSTDNDSLSNLNLEKKINLYPYDTIFNQFLPDTSLVFTSNNSLKEYIFEKNRTFDSVLNSWQLVDSIQTFVIKRTAQILYADYSQTVTFKYFKNKKDNLSLSLLSDYSPFSRIITVKDRLAEYKSYSVEMQQSEIGKKTIANLIRYEFQDNIGKSFTPFYDEEIITPDKRQNPLKTLLNKNAKYYIFVFGASWCSPCVIEERMLKYWHNDIEPFKIQIVGISVDHKVNKWEEYIEAEKFPWETILLPRTFNDRLGKILNLGDGIPMNLLINSNGVILAQNTDIRKVLEAVPELNIESQVSR